jgi:1,4-alpha-glucan branching enzyme
VYDPAAFDWGDDDFQMPSWDDLVIYEMHVGTFGGSADTMGTFDSARRRLRYLEHLGVSAVQVMPPLEFAGDVSWGYNPAHLFAIESAYGGPDAFKAFVREAHARGLGGEDEIMARRVHGAVHSGVLSCPLSRTRERAG